MNKALGPGSTVLHNYAAIFTEVLYRELVEIVVWKTTSPDSVPGHTHTHGTAHIFLTEEVHRMLHDSTTTVL